MDRAFRFAVLSVVMLLASCSTSGEVEGKVSDLTENTITVTTAKNEIVTFSTRDAKMCCPAGIHRGSPVTVEFKGEITDGFGCAKRVNAPEDYNLLLGRWIAPCKWAPECMCGFELLPDGTVIEIGDHAILYNCWRFVDGTLSFAEVEECLDEEIFDLAHHWKVEHVDHSTLTLSGYEQTMTFARSER